MAAVGYTGGDPAKVNVADVGTVGGPAGPLDASGLIPSAQVPGGGGGGGGPSLAGTVAAETVYGVGASAGSAVTASRGDHTHGTPSLASTTPAASAVGAAAAVGTDSTPARADHVHARESFGAVVGQTAYGAASGDGTATTVSRADHTHGTPAAPTAASVGADPAGAATSAVTTHAGAIDPHGDRAYADAGDATRVPSTSTVTVAPAAPLLKHQRNFAIDSSAQNIFEFWVNNSLKGWLNEWGGFRGTPAYAWDAVIRMIAASGQTGNIIEYQNNPRTQVLWGVTASGRTVMGNGSAAAVTMAPVYVAPASAVLPGDLPAGLPSGTVVVQLAS